MRLLNWPDAFAAYLVAREACSMRQPKDENKDRTASIPILITSSITPHDKGVKLSDPDKRLFHAIEAIEQWIRITPKSQFVLCDGSGFDFEPIVKARFPHAAIECLCFQNDLSKILIYGRGYGEGEIVKFALKHSEYIAHSDAFAKCSSKLWVENYPVCLKEWRGDCLFSGIFKNTFSLLKPIEMLQVDTRFYIVKNNFYIRNLNHAHHQIGLAPGFGLEDSFYHELLKIKQEKYLFSTPPVVMGVGGGTGTYYKSSWLRVSKEKIRLENVKRSANFRRIFNF